MSRRMRRRHNCDYRTPGVSLVISPYLRCARVLSLPQVARTFDAVEAKAVALATCAVKDLRCASMNSANF